MALELDASGDQIDHGDVAQLDAPAAFTLAFWATKSADLTANTPFLKKGDAGGTWLYTSSASANNFSVGQQGASEARTATGAWPVDTWTHLGFVYDSGGSPKLLLKVNGVTVTNEGADVTLADQGTAALIFQWLNGSMKFAHVKAWDAALTADEYLAEKRHHGVQRAANNILWCPYDTLDATDLSPSGYHGTQTGAVLVDGPPADSPDIIVPVGTLTFTGAAPTVENSSEITRTPTAAALVLTGAAPGLLEDIRRDPTAGALAFTGAAPDLLQQILRTPGAGALSVAGAAPTIEGLADFVDRLEFAPLIDGGRFVFTDLVTVLQAPLPVFVDRLVAVAALPVFVDVLRSMPNLDPLFSDDLQRTYAEAELT